MIFCKGAAATKMQIERNGRDDRETTVVEAMLKVPCAGELLGACCRFCRLEINVFLKMRLTEQL